MIERGGDLGVRHGCLITPAWRIMANDSEVSAE